MTDAVNFDPELKEAIEDGKSRTKKILDAIELYQDLDEKTLALKKTLLNFESANETYNVQQSGAVPEQIMIPRTKSGDSIRIKVYRPSSLDMKLPCIYNIHGGGMMVGSIDNSMAQLSHLSEVLGAIVVDVNYRLAPENPYPAGVDDCYEGLVWVSNHADELNIDPSRIGLLGESAGGGLAAATALKSRDSGGPEIKFQTLIAPMLDDRNNTPSSKMCSGVWPSWPREMNILGWRALLGNIAGNDEVSPYAAPARAEYLGDLPPAYIEVGDMEVFRDEDISYAKRLMEHSIPVELHVYPGTFHSWYAHAPGASVSRRAIRNRMEWIQSQLKRK